MANLKENKIFAGIKAFREKLDFLLAGFELTACIILGDNYLFSIL